MSRIFPALFALALSLCATRAGQWQTIRDCTLISHPGNDGDSFHVRANGRERIFRLYLVDCPEAEDGEKVEERVATQAKFFRLSEEQSMAVGKQAAAFTRAALSRPFTVETCWQDAYGSSHLPREFAFITTADGQDLGEMLVSRGLARSYGEAVPPGRSSDARRPNYDALQGKARGQRLGAWANDVATPASEPANEDDAETEADRSKRSQPGDMGELIPSSDGILRSLDKFQ